MKRILATIALLALILLSLILLAVKVTGSSVFDESTAPRAAIQCQEGEVAQDGVCRKRVTGCPYGDSISLGPECDKHAPQTTADSDKGEPKAQSAQTIVPAFRGK